MDVMVHLACIPLQKTKVESGPGLTSHPGRVGSRPDFAVHWCPPTGGIIKARTGAKDRSWSGTQEAKTRESC